LFLAAAPLQAAPIVIGSFYFVDNLPIAESVVVENLSAVPGLADNFEEIVIELELAAGGSEIYGYGEVGVLGPSFVLDGPTNPLFTFSPLDFSPGSNTAALDLLDPSLYTSASLVLMFQSILVNNTNPIALQAGASSQITIGAVPEPATILLLASGATAGALRRRKKPLQ
jgi:hypothetical protein